MKVQRARRAGIQADRAGRFVHLYKVYREDTKLYRKIPHLDGTVVGAGHDARRVELQAGDAAGVAPKREHAFPCLQVPDLCIALTDAS